MIFPISTPFPMDFPMGNPAVLDRYVCLQKVIQRRPYTFWTKTWHVHNGKEMNMNKKDKRLEELWDIHTNFTYLYQFRLRHDLHKFLTEQFFNYRKSINKINLWCQGPFFRRRVLLADATCHKIAQEVPGNPNADCDDYDQLPKASNPLKYP